MAKPVEQAPAKPLTLTAEKFFSVAKGRGLLGISCRIFIAPAKDDVRVRRGSTVAWVLGNNCDDATSLQLRFFRKGGGKQTEVYPIQFQTMQNGVLYGTVIDDGSTEEIIYEYTAIIGRHRKDPEIIVF